MLFYSRKNRPFELGPYPLERLSHEKSIFAVEAEKIKDKNLARGFKND